jgi:hypothetical protein
VRVTEGTIDRNGEKLTVPKIEFEGWWTSLELPHAKIIQLYREHATSEQFHSDKFAWIEFGQPQAARRGRAKEGADQFNLETSVGRGGARVHRGAGQGATTRNGCSIPRRSNAAMRREGRAIRPVARSPIR